MRSTERGNWKVWFISREIPVAPPSTKWFGNKKPLKPKPAKIKPILKKKKTFVKGSF